MNIIWHRFPQALIDTDLGKKKKNNTKTFSVLTKVIYFLIVAIFKCVKSLTLRSLTQVVT